MKPILRAGVVVALAALAGTGCMLYRAPAVPPIGTGFNQTAAPMNLQLHATEVGPKQGSATSSAILGLISTGDCSVAQAARNGNITTVNHVDSEYFNLLFGLFSQHTTRVYGR